MRLMFHMRGERQLIGLGVVCLLFCTATANAQLLPANPLRTGGKQVTNRQSNVQLASAAEPVRQRGSAIRSANATRRVTHRPVSYGIDIPRHSTGGFVPRHEMVGNTMVTQEMVTDPAMMTSDGNLVLDPFPSEGEVLQSGCCDEPEDTCLTCGDNHGCLIPCPTLALKNIELFSGVQGFTASPNQGDGSFGFHYGLNWAAPVPCVPSRALGMQIGVRGVSSDYSGTSFTTDNRNEVFATAGLFRRVDWGLQGGLVVDYLRDDWYYDYSVTQLRGEISWVYPQCHELGFWFASHLRDDTVETTTWIQNRKLTGSTTFEATDLYAFFYRRRFEEIGGGYGRVFAGFTGDSEGLIGADFKLPLTESWALQTGFTYVIPDENNNQIAYRQEAWNVGITMIWYPGARKAVGNDYFRPLFDVADNGSFIPRTR